MKRFLFAFLILFSLPAAAQMKIVATYPPIQSMVLQITEGVYPVNLLHKKGGPHHHVQLKPSQMKTLQHADIVFWAGEELENYMPDALKTAAPNALSVPLIQNDKLALKPSISDPTKPDMHFWLNIDNALATLDKIEEVMIQKDPANKEKFAANKKKAAQYLEELKKEAGFIPNHKKLVALHEGFDYFFESFHLNGQSLGAEPQNIQTPLQIQQFKAKIAELKPACIIVEPSLERREKSALGLDKYSLQKTDAFGWNINVGAAHFYKMMKWNITQLKKCADN